MTEPTDRQLVILVAWIEWGGTRPAAEAMQVHPDTMRHWLAEIQAVLGADSSAQAFAIAVKRGLIDPSTLHVDEAA